MQPVQRSQRIGLAQRRIQRIASTAIIQECAAWRHEGSRCMFGIGLTELLIVALVVASIIAAVVAVIVIAIRRR